VLEPWHTWCDPLCSSSHDLARELAPLTRFATETLAELSFESVSLMRRQSAHYGGGRTDTTVCLAYPHRAPATAMHVWNVDQVSVSSRPFCDDCRRPHRLGAAVRCALSER